MLKLAAQALRQEKASTKQRGLRDEDDQEAIAEVVDRNIKRFFEGIIPAGAIDAVSVNGRTMREQMIVDRVALLKSGRERGSSGYFGDIKKVYMAALQGRQVERGTASDGSVPEGLQQALDRALHTQRRVRNREPVLHWIWQHTEPLSKSSIVKLMDMLVETQTRNCAEHARVVIEVFKALVALNQVTRDHSAVQAGVALLEEALKCTYRAEERQFADYDFEVFWDKYQSIASWFLAPDQVAAINAEEADWSSCAPAFASLSTSSNLGREIFTEYCPQVVAEHVSKRMHDSARELVLSSGTIDQANISEYVTKMTVQAGRLQLDKVSAKHTYKIPFMGQTLERTATSACELARLHTDAVVKTAAVVTEMLPRLKFEAEVVPWNALGGLGDEFRHAKVAADVCTKWAAVRQEMDTLLERTPPSTAGEVAAFMEGKTSVWHQDDPTFGLTCGYVRLLAGPLGGTMLLQRAVGLLPDAEGKPKYATVVKALLELELTHAWVFGTASARGQVKTLVEIVSDMERGDGPSKAHFPKNTLLEQAGGKLANFCNELDDGSTPMYGLDALRFRMQRLQKKLASGEVRDLGEVTLCMVFKWLLPTAEAETLDDMSERAHDFVMTRPDAKSGAAPSTAAMEIMVAGHLAAKGKAERKRPAPKAKVAAAKKRGRKSM